MTAERGKLADEGARQAKQEAAIIRCAEAYEFKCPAVECDGRGTWVAFNGPNDLDGHTVSCDTCNGSGVVRGAVLDVVEQTATPTPLGSRTRALFGVPLAIPALVGVATYVVVGVKDDEYTIRAAAIDVDAVKATHLAAVVCVATNEDISIDEAMDRALVEETVKLAEQESKP